MTTGIPAIDYFLSCDAAEPEDAGDHADDLVVDCFELSAGDRRALARLFPDTR